MILPYVEQVPLYNAVNQGVTILGYENRTIFAASISLYACPDDPESGRPRLPDIGQLIASGLATPGEDLTMVFTSYAGCFGAQFVDAFPQPALGCQVPSATAAQADGVFNDLTPIRFSSVADGLSNTLFVVEKATTPLQALDPVNMQVFRRFGGYITGIWETTSQRSSTRLTCSSRCPSQQGRATRLRLPACILAGSMH